MDNNILCLNGDPIEVRLIGSRHQISNAGHLYLTLDGLVVEVQSRVRNLGFIFDANRSIDSFVQSTVKTTFFHLRNITGLHPTLNSLNRSCSRYICFSLN